MVSYHKIYMSPVQSSNLQSQLCALWKKQKFCDAVIKSDTISVMAHRLVLAASCPMLQSMENYSFGSLLEIRVESDMTKESVMAFLQYLYEGYLMLTEENYSHVERLARSMHIDSIISCCKDFSQSILSSHSFIHGPTDQADFKHVRITNLLRVLDSSQKRPHKCSDSDFSNILTQPSSYHCSSESIAFQQVSQVCPALFQSCQGERIKLRQGSLPSKQSESCLTHSNIVSTNINTKKALDEGVIFFSNATCNFKEGSSTSLNSIGPHPVQTSGRGGQLNGCPLTPTISNVYSLQTVQSSNFELGKKTPQAEPYPVLLKEVPEPLKFLSGDSSGVSDSCAGIDQNNEQPVLSQSSSMQQLDIHLNESSRESCEKSNSNGTNTDPSAEGGHGVIKAEPENSTIQTDDGMFMSVSQRDETQTAYQRDETQTVYQRDDTQTATQRDEIQTSQSSSLHDNPSMSSEESSGQDEMSSSSTSKTGVLKVKRRNIAGRAYKKGIPMEIDYRRSMINFMESNGAQRGEHYLPRGLRKKAAQHFRVSPTTITNIWAQYCKEGCVKIPVQINRGRKKKLSKEDMEYIQFLKQSKPSMQLTDVRDELLKKSNLKRTVGLTTISKALAYLNMTHERKSKV